MQKTSIISEEFDGRTFRYEFLQELILEELFVHIKNMKKARFLWFSGWVLGWKFLFWVHYMLENEVFSIKLRSPNEFVWANYETWAKFINFQRVSPYIKMMSIWQKPIVKASLKLGRFFFMAGRKLWDAMLLLLLTH